MIKEFKLSPNKSPFYIKSQLATFLYKGKVKTWELLHSHDSVAVLLYHTDRKEFVFVKQFRAPIYHMNNCGMSVELCAGLVDKNASFKQIAKEEIEEECGYSVELENIDHVITCLSSPGRSSSSQHMFYAEVNNESKTSDGGGINDEDIEVIYVSIEEVEEFFKRESLPISSGMAYMLLWWRSRNV